MRLFGVLVGTLAMTFAATWAAEDGAQAVQKKLADPAFRLRAEEPDGMAFVAEALGLNEEQKKASYAWLKERAKVEQGLELECRVLAWLARDLHEPAEEIAKADDLVLRLIPGLAEVWIRRAEDHLASGRSEAEAWAIEAYVQGLRRAPLAALSWKQVLAGAQDVDWQAKAAKAGQMIPWAHAVADAMRDTPRGQARLDTAGLVITTLKHPDVRAQPAAAESLLSAVVDYQPQVAMGDVMGLVEAMRAADRGNQLDVSRYIARLLILAPVTQEVMGKDAETGAVFAERWESEHPAPKATKSKGTDALAAVKQEIAGQQWEAAKSQAMTLRSGYRTLLTTWEDTTPRYQPATLAHEVLIAAMGANKQAFATECLDVAKAQPWNENVISHALVALAIATGLDETQMGLAEKLDTAARGRVALRLYAFTAADRYPQPVVAKWVEEYAMSTLVESKGLPMDRPVYESLLLSMDCLKQAHNNEALQRVLKAALKTLPRVVDMAHWRRLSEFVVNAGQAQMASDFADSWLTALGQQGAQKEHLSAIADAAVLGGPECGKGFAKAAMTLWSMLNAVSPNTDLSPTVVACRVAQAQVMCGDMVAFRSMVDQLQTIPNSSSSTWLGVVAKELLALKRLLDGEPGTRPGVDSWVQAPTGPNDTAKLQWQLVLPELGLNPTKPYHIPIRERDGLPPTVKHYDARWWRAGTPLPALQSLSGKFDIDVFIGVNADDMELKGIQNAAAFQGAMPLNGVPAAGYFRVDVHFGRYSVLKGEVRPYSLASAVAATGPEPDAAEAGQVNGAPMKEMPPPPSWQPEDTLRWGRLAGPPVAIQPGTEYLLAEWAAPLATTDPLKVRLILLDENQKPLGPVPVSSTGPALGRVNPLDAPLAVSHRSHLQLFRPGEWAGDGDMVFPRNADGGGGMADARYMAFVTRDKNDGPLPLLQLRPYKEQATGLIKSTASALTPFPELNHEHIADVGFNVHSWHVTFATDRAVMGGKGEMIGFDVGRIPWKTLVHSQSALVEGNEWPLSFEPGRALVIEPSTSGARDLGLRFLPMDQRGERYAACERLSLPLPTYDESELSEQGDGAVLLAASKPGDHPEPVCAWVEPDGKCHVLPLPRPPLKGVPGIKVAWWGPQGSRFTVYEDGLLFEIEHLNGLRLVGVRPGSPEEMPEDASPGRAHRKRTWFLERPDSLAQLDKKSGAIIRRFHLPVPCEGTPMSLRRSTYVLLFTIDHEIIRVNPPPRPGD